MTKWVLKCAACGEEKIFEAAFNLAPFGGRIYLYCKKCRSNRDHVVLGCLDGELCQSAGADVID